jgi:alanyl-tRNA synthetase
VPGLVQRQLDQNKDLQRQNDALTEQLIGNEIDELVARAVPTGAARVVTQLYPDRSVDALKQTAALLRERPGLIALLGTAAGGKLTLVFARSEDAPQHMGNLLRDTLKAFGGGGGGRPDFAQGGGVDPARGNDVLQYANKLIQ